MRPKIRIANALYVDLVVNCFLVFLHAMGKGLIKYSAQERRKININKVNLISKDKTILKGLQLKK